jgi:hypothetical protein
MKSIGRTTLSVSFVFAFGAVAFGQHGNWSKPVDAKPTFGRYIRTSGGRGLSCAETAPFIATR